jgi:hypothetical protein
MCVIPAGLRGLDLPYHRFSDSFFLGISRRPPGFSAKIFLCHTGKRPLPLVMILVAPDFLKFRLG